MRHVNDVTRLQGFHEGILFSIEAIEYFQDQGQLLAFMERIRKKLTIVTIKKYIEDLTRFDNCKEISAYFEEFEKKELAPLCETVSSE